MAEQERTTPPIDESVVMLYYADLAPVSAFYGEVLGLESVYRSDAAHLYRLTPGSVVGLVQEGEQAYHSAQSENAVMLSIVTPDVDGWYERLADRKDITMLKPIYESENNPIRAFLFADPGGYTVEFFSWLTPAE